MSIIAAKYFQNIGWCGIKNYDVTNKPDIRLRKSFRNDIERLYIWDDSRKFAEGVNEFGVCVLTLEVDKEHTPRLQKKHTEEKKRIYYSPDGLRIRKLLYCKNAEEAKNQLVELQVPGNTLIFDSAACFCVSGVFEDDLYKFDVKTGSDYQHIVVNEREDGVTEEQAKQRSDVVLRELQFSKTPEEMLQGFSSRDDTDEIVNPLRLSGKIRTSGQLVLVPSEKTIHYRPIWCSCKFDLDNLNSPKERTFVEIVSTRKLLSFKEAQK